MPQLNTLTFFTHYVYVLIVLFILFLLLTNILIPKINKLFSLRVNLGEETHKNETIKFEIFEKIFKL